MNDVFGWKCKLVVRNLEWYLFLSQRGILLQIIGRQAFETAIGYPDGLLKLGG
jgi:hypothetical protein